MTKSKTFIDTCKFLYNNRYRKVEFNNSDNENNYNYESVAIFAN